MINVGLRRENMNDNAFVATISFVATVLLLSSPPVGITVLSAALTMSGLLNISFVATYAIAALITYSLCFAWITYLRRVGVLHAER